MKVGGGSEQMEEALDEEEVAEKVKAAKRND